MRSERAREIQSALALVAVVVGAGFASGREVMRFFSIFGRWSWVGCALAALLLAGLSGWTALLAARLRAYDLATLCRRALGGRSGQAAAWLNGVLIIVTAGAMIAAMGELSALALPVHGAYEIGIVFSVAVTALVAERGLPTIAAISGWLLPTCLLLYALLLREPWAGAAAEVPLSTAWHALPMAFAYAAMNATLGCGVLCELGQEQSGGSVLRSCAIASLMLMALLFGANAALYRHADELRDAALPVVMLARSLGAVGYWLCIITLSLAVMTTLIALCRTLARMLDTLLPRWPSRILSLALPLAVGLTGFATLVGSLYPLLGAASTLLFLAIIFKPIKNRSQVHNKSVIHSDIRHPEGRKQNEPDDGRPTVST